LYRVTKVFSDEDAVKYLNFDQTKRVVGSMDNFLSFLAFLIFKVASVVNFSIILGFLSGKTAYEHRFPLLIEKLT
jgi:hypothetical protein